MTFRIPKHRKSKGTVKQSNYDLSLSAILFFMWRSGQLKTYPLNETEYPDTLETEKIMTYEMLKMKLQHDCEKVDSFKNRIMKK